MKTGEHIDHGTISGWQQGCRTNHCPSPITCRDLRTRYMGDYSFRKQIDAGLTVEQIHEAETSGAIAEQERRAAAAERARRQAQDDARAERAAQKNRELEHARQQRAAEREELRAAAAAERAAARAAAKAAREAERKEIAAERLAARAEARAAARQARLENHAALTEQQRAERAATREAARVAREEARAAAREARVGRATERATNKNTNRTRGDHKHGTAYGYQLGCRDDKDGTTTCPATPTCSQANNAYHREYMRKRERLGIPAEKHGTAYGYQLGCRTTCPATPSCREAQRDADTARRRNRGEEPLAPRADAAPVYEHLITLRTAGMTLEQIAAAADLKPKTLQHFVYHRPRRIVMDADRARRILAVRS